MRVITLSVAAVTAAFTSLTGSGAPPAETSRADVATRGFLAAERADAGVQVHFKIAQDTFEAVERARQEEEAAAAARAREEAEARAQAEAAAARAAAQAAASAQARSAVPFAPPAAAPAVDYGSGAIQDIIRRAFEPLGPAAVDWGLRVAKCESGYNPRAVGSGTYYGLFQFLPQTFRSTPYGGGDIFDPVTNANAAAWKYANNGASAWGCR